MISMVYYSLIAGLGVAVISRKYLKWIILGGIGRLWVQFIETEKLNPVPFYTYLKLMHLKRL